MALTLVTGVSSFAGERLAIELARQGYAVRGLSRTGRGLSRLHRNGVETVMIDRRDRRSVFRALEGVGTVYHVDAGPGDGAEAGAVTRQELFDCNLGGTRHLLEAAHAHGAGRVLHVDSSVEPDMVDDRRESLLAAERFVTAFSFRTGLQTTVIRSAGVYGPGDTRFLDLFRSVARGRLVLNGWGGDLCHLTFVDDFCRAIILAANSPDAAGRTYGVCESDAVSVDTLVACVAEELDVRRPRVSPVRAAVAAVDGLRRRLRVPRARGLRGSVFEPLRTRHLLNMSAASAELGFAPRVGLGEGLRRTVAWYREHALL